jgi:hypothetical protein
LVDGCCSERERQQVRTELGKLERLRRSIVRERRFIVREQIEGRSLVNSTAGKTATNTATFKGVRKNPVA